MRRTYSPLFLEVRCEQCSSPFEVRHSYEAHRQRVGMKPTRFCGRVCSSASQQSGQSVDTVLANCDRNGLTECWIWTGSIIPTTGYGRIGGREKHITAHRLSYKAFKGDIPTGLVVRHTCDTPLCVNPEHLILGTPKDNKQDAIDRQRHARGSNTGSAKLKEADIPKIRAALASGVSQSDVARKFGVSHGIIFRIDHRVTWKHVP